MSSATHSLLLALIGALGVGAPALAYNIWRGRKIGPKEENELIARMAQEATSAGSEMLIQAREERKEMKEKLAEQAAVIGRLQGERDLLLRQQADDRLEGVG